MNFAHTGVLDGVGAFVVAWRQNGMKAEWAFGVLWTITTILLRAGFTLCVHDRVGYERNCKWACIVRSAGPVLAWLGEVGLHWVSEMISSDPTVMLKVSCVFMHSYLIIQG